MLKRIKEKENYSLLIAILASSLFCFIYLNREEYPFNLLVSGAIPSTLEWIGFISIYVLIPPSIYFVLNPNNILESLKKDNYTESISMFAGYGLIIVFIGIIVGGVIAIMFGFINGSILK